MLLEQLSLTPPDGIKLHVERAASMHGNRCGAVLTVLEELQKQNSQNYLSSPVLRQVARTMGLSLSQIYSVVTFYAFFNLSPQGKNTIAVCRGTACHTRGSRHLLEALERAMGFGASENGSTEHVSRTTEDAQFTVRTVACFGQCALAPVVEVNRIIHGHMNEQKLLGAVDRLTQGERS